MSSILTVTQINRYLAFSIKSDIKLRGIAIKGEISNLLIQYQTGHIYFTLKDDSSRIKVIMFSSNAERLRFALEDGMSVIAMGNIEIYEKSGSYQLIASDIQPLGIGQLALAYEQLKTKLEKEGFFDLERKKTIPGYPKNIGIITSFSGAVFHDIINVLNRRYPIAKISVFNTSVQGSEAIQQICTALKKADISGMDVLIIARGGGSLEDLSPFNSETVAMEVVNLNTPIISAIGHETDVTICDFVADLRAPTPSVAAELCSENIENIYLELSGYSHIFQRILKNKIQDYSIKLKHLSEKLINFTPRNTLINQRLILRNYEKKIIQIMHSKLVEYKLKYAKLESDLENLSYKNVIKRGFSIIQKNDLVVKSVDDISSGDVLELFLTDGNIKVKVIQIEE